MNHESVKTGEEYILISNLQLKKANHSGREVQVMKCLRSLNTRIVGSNPTWGMDGCVYSVFCCCPVGGRGGEDEEGENGAEKEDPERKFN
jgi:hypothetical protein